MSAFVSRVRSYFFPDAELDTDVGKTYFALRIWLAAIGGLLPIVLVVAGSIAGVAWDCMSSISAFHWLDSLTRDIFVGALCAIGLTLIVYHGYGWLEDWLLNLAGVFIALVAFKPMPWPPCRLCTELADPDKPCHQGFDLHYVAACAFFGLIALSIFFCAKKTLVAPMPEKQQKSWRRIYNAFAFAMVAFPALALISSDQWHLTFWAEVAGVEVFAAYWLVKTYELRSVSKIETPGRPLQRMAWSGGELRRLEAR
jgi:hypothetical protein